MTGKERKRAEAAILLAISRAGGVSALAELIGVTKGAVSQWDVCPPARVLDVERITGISRGDLRPDWYPGEGTHGD